MLYFLLTGKAPFAAETEEEPWERARHCDFDRSALKKAGVPRRLERICLQAMACEPERRHRSAAKLEQALRRFPGGRRIVIGVATSILLVLGISTFILGYASSHPRPSRSIPPLPPHGFLPTPALADGPLRIIHFDIEHMAQRPGGQFEVRGNLGEQSFAVRSGDDVTVRAELSEPSYAYLLAFRPDCVDEVLDPDNADTLPKLTRKLCYPPESKAHVVYRLEDGSGLYAFAVVVSRNELPSYNQWKNEHGNAPWRKGLSGASGVVWSHDGRRLAPLTATENTPRRGKGATIHGGGDVIAELSRWLQAVPGVDCVAIKAFPVPEAPRP